MSTISNTITTGITIGAGTYTSPLTITATGYIDASLEAIHDESFPGATIVNAGRIVATATYGEGIVMRFGGLVSNTGTISAGSGDIQINNDAGTVTNSGTILGTSGYAVFLGNGGSVGNTGTGLIQSYLGVFVTGSAGTVTNSGTIAGTSHYGVFLNAGGSVGNTGTGLIQGNHGIYIRFGAAAVTNSGTISGTSGNGVTLVGGSVSNTSTGLIRGNNNGVSGASTVTNSGTIAGTSRYGVSAGGSVGNSGTGALITGIGGVFIGGSAGTVTNSGTIAGTGAVGKGVRLNAGGSVDNMAGLIQGYYHGVYIGGTAGTVTNSGTIAGTIGYGVLLRYGGSIANTGTGLIQGYHGVRMILGPGTVTNSGTIAATTGFGVELLKGGIVANTGLIQGATAQGIILFSFGSYGAVVTNTGTIAATTNDAVDLPFGGTVVDAGTISGGYGTAVSFGPFTNRMVLEHGYALSGIVSVAGAANTLELAGTAGAVTVNFNNGLGFTNFGTVTFGAPSGNSEILKISNTAALPGTISGFAQFHDIIDLTQINPTGIQTPTLNGSNQLVVTNGSQTVDLQLDNEDYSGVVWQAGTDGSGGTDISVACYCPGTMIETPDGEVAIEQLQIGDVVTTLSGEARPIRWIGRRAYDGRFIAGNRRALPICVKAGALAEGVPVRDLYVSPGHALYIDGVLVQAEHLVNGATIVQADAVDTVEYIHIELDSHDIIVADGAPAESYTDCDNRYMFANGAEYAVLYVDDDRPTWNFCRKRLEWEDEALTEIRAALLWRTEALGHELDPDADLHLIVDRMIVRPIEAADRFYRFEIPAGAREVDLASRSNVPAELDATSRDMRRLGVPVEQIVLADAHARIDIRHCHPALDDGFHGAEAGHRWTDGLGRLPQALLAPFDGPLTIELYLATSRLVYRTPFAAAVSTKPLTVAR